MSIVVRIPGEHIIVAVYPQYVTRSIILETYTRVRQMHHQISARVYVIYDLRLVNRLPDDDPLKLFHEVPHHHHLLPILVLSTTYRHSVDVSSPATTARIPLFFDTDIALQFAREQLNSS